MRGWRGRGGGGEGGGGGGGRGGGGGGGMGGGGGGGGGGERGVVGGGEEGGQLNLCSYCLIQHESLEVEHYEPKDYAPEKIDDPGNLLLACRRCNGPGGKGDYHPQHKVRRRLPHDRTGFSSP